MRACRARAGRYDAVMTDRHLFRQEARALTRIAAPVVMAEFGWASMGLIDSLVVGPLGPAAIAATGLGTGVFIAIVVFGMGLMLGLDTLVSQAFGAGRLDECRTLLHQGLWLAVIVTPLVIGLDVFAVLSMDRWGLNPEIARLTRPYLLIVGCSAPPLLIFTALRRYLLGVHIVRPVMTALLTANAINLLANWVFVYGKFGLPALGVSGSALATTVARLYLAVVLGLVVYKTRPQGHDVHAAGTWRPDLTRLGRLARLGIPAALQLTLEVGAFSLATAFAARLDAASSASHQLALNIESLAYMVPLGLCSAAAVRVGHAFGARDARRTMTAGWAALAVGGCLMVALGLTMALVPHALLSPFSHDPRVLELGSALLGFAAAFQLFDGVQTITTGVLRGIGDTVKPMAVHLVAYWVLGLPIGYLLCFRYGWGVRGLWAGFTVGLVVAGCVLLGIWTRRSRRLAW